MTKEFGTGFRGGRSGGCVRSFCLGVFGGLCVVVVAARPHYGGTLRVETESAIHSLDPAIEPVDAAERAARAHLIPLVFEALVSIDAGGGLRPALAVSWDHDEGNIRWRFRLRPPVRLHDGSVLQPPQLAAVLGARERSWRVGSSGEAIVIDTGRPHPDLPWELADARFAFAARSATGDLFGSGPFRLDRVEPHRITLRAFEDHWSGRPFVDTVQIDLSRSFSDQLSSVELGRADLVAVRPTDSTRLVQHRIRSVASAPIELVAMVFEPHRSGTADEGLRHTIARSINRAALATILLQRQADPAAGLLPSWLSGYAPGFLTDSRPRLSPGAVPPERRSVVLRVDPSDAVAQEIAARVSVDVREAGVTMPVQAPAGLAPRPDVRLVRITLEPTTPSRALSAALLRFGPRLAGLADGSQLPAAGAPLETVLDAERALVERAVIVPLVHIREVYALGDRVESWNGPAVLGSGAWNLATVWIGRDP